MSKQTLAGSRPAVSQSPSRGVLQRACACGQHSHGGGECEGCRKKREGTLQRAATGAAPTNEVPPIVHEVLNSAGQPLDSATRAFMEPHFGHDFSRVRVHTDAKAAQSARAVEARAYAVGPDVAFGAGEYAPQTSYGRQLLAHELTHVVQQSGTDVEAISEQHLETEANRVAADVARVNGSAGILSRSGQTLLRQSGGGQSPSTQSTPVIAPVPANQAQNTAIENARRAAAVRTQIALMRLRGIVPSGSEEMRQRARALARVMFQWDEPNMDQIEEIVGSIVTHLMNPQVMVAGHGDPECGLRAAYVRGLRPPIILCPAFFSSAPEEQTRTMIHESAHLSRIGSASLGESYCVFFDCQTSCGGFDSADSWAHFIHCLSGQTSDQNNINSGPTGGARQPGGSGGTP